MNSDVWKTPDSRIGVEVGRKVVDSIEYALIVSADGAFPSKSWWPVEQLTREKSRYEGARGGRLAFQEVDATSAVATNAEFSGRGASRGPAATTG